MKPEITEQKLIKLYNKLDKAVMVAEQNKKKPKMAWKTRGPIIGL